MKFAWGGHKATDRLVRQVLKGKHLVTVWRRTEWTGSLIWWIWNNAPKVAADWIQSVRILTRMYYTSWERPSLYKTDTGTGLKRLLVWQGYSSPLYPEDNSQLRDSVIDRQKRRPWVCWWHHYISRIEMRGLKTPLNDANTSNIGFITGFKKIRNRIWKQSTVAETSTRRK